MYENEIKNIINAISARLDNVVQMRLSGLLLNDEGKLNENAKKELEAKIPGSKVIFGASDIGFRAGYFQVDNYRYYFA